ncbi:HET-domain-containing protein [Mycena venus]|uniref:HET-domain-containing protein n=1 Tax=Mycena venus TaxID=2733690 RepID=A0A8H6XJC7_9AGAR|nr:HET-domain-containing protein [Mycena venus]
MATVGFAYGSFGDIIETIKLIPKIDGLIRSGGRPSTEWEATNRELQSLCNELTRLATVHGTGGDQLIHRQLKEELKRCLSIASDFHSKLAASRSFISKALWLASEEKELERFQRQIVERRAALGAIVDQINLVGMRDLQDIGEKLSLGSAYITQSDLEEKLRKWLEFPPSMARKQHESQRIHQKGTGKWLLAAPEFTTWKNANNSSYLWITGPSGVGKTVLSSTVIKKLFCAREKDARAAAVAYFYFDFGEEQKRRVEIMLRCIVLQLSAQSPNPYAALDRQYKLSQGQILPTQQNLMDVLETLLSEIGHAYIVLDALDECNNNTLLIQLISRLQRWTDSRLHLLLTSQPHEIFTAAFVDMSQVALKFETTKSDIRVFVSSQLRSNTNLEHFADRAEDVSTKVVEKSGGMFRLAACLLEELSRQRLEPDMDAILANLPGDLFGIYDRFLEPIHPNDFIHVARVLHWLLCSCTPITLDEMQDALAFNWSEPQRPVFDPSKRGNLMEGVCNMLQGLVIVDRVPSGPGPLVMLSHSSVADYIVSGEFRQKYRHHIGYGPSDTFLAQTCMGYLLHFADDDDLGPNYPPPSEYPLFTYASTFWTDHLRRCDDPALLLPFTIQLLQYIGIWDPPHLPVLLRCAQIGYIEGVQFLLECGANVNEVGCGYYGSALTAACRMGHKDIAALLLHNGANVSAPGNENVLQFACEEGHTEIVQLLIENGANVNEGSRYDGGPLQAAFNKGHVDIAQILLEHGATYKTENIDRALRSACGLGRTETVRLLLAHGANANAHPHGWTVLQAATWGGHTEVVRLLLQSGASIGPGWAELEEPVEEGRTEIVRALLEDGTDVVTGCDERDWQEFLSKKMHSAAAKGYTEIVRLLLKHSADIQVTDTRDQCVLKGAKDREHGRGAGLT